jgi:hypothetical protein
MISTPLCQMFSQNRKVIFTHSTQDLYLGLTVPTRIRWWRGSRIYFLVSVLAAKISAYTSHLNGWCLVTVTQNSDLNLGASRSTSAKFGAGSSVQSSLMTKVGGIGIERVNSGPESTPLLAITVWNFPETLPLNFALLVARNCCFKRYTYSLKCLNGN